MLLLLSDGGGMDGRMFSRFAKNKLFDTCLYDAAWCGPGIVPEGTSLGFLSMPPVKYTRGGGTPEDQQQQRQQQQHLSALCVCPSQNREIQQPHNTWTLIHQLKLPVTTQEF